MLKRFLQNTIISTIAFGAAALLGLIVIPVIIHTWGVMEFGLIVLARLLVPTGIMALLDLGLSEVTTQAVARAREHRNWDLAGRQLSFLSVLSILLTLVLGAAVSLAAPSLTAILKVGPEHVEKFTEIVRFTALANLILIPALVSEGIVKGFERYNLLRVAEVTTTMGYVLATIAASYLSASFDVVAYIYLASLVVRALTVLAAALVTLKFNGVRFAAWNQDIRHDLWHQCALLLQGKVIGGVAGPAPSLVVGVLFGPTSVGVYDALVRLSRVSKTVVALLTSALLPVASRLDERGNISTFQRLGEVGLVMLPMFTVPPLVAAAVLSPEIMRLWIGPLMDPYAAWMGLSFLIPICAQYLAFGSVIFLTRREIQARLNLMMGAQLAVWAVVSAVTLQLFAERAIILGQVVASLVVLPWQLDTLRRALDLDSRRFLKALGTQALILILGSVLLAVLAGYIQLDSMIMLAAVAGGFSLMAWLAQYFLVLERRHRAIFPEVGHLMGLSPKSNGLDAHRVHE